MPARFAAEVSGHSTRVGAAQDLAELDIDLAAITQAGGWKSTRTPLQYAEKIYAARSPLTLAEPRAAGGGANPSYRLSWGATQIVIDGSITDSDAILKFIVYFQKTPGPHALVPGGWLPVPLAIPARFLVASEL
jgi:hypothetical protein